MPDSAIISLHNTPHLNSDFSSSSNDFAITSDSVWNSYSQSVLTLPILIGAIGIFFVLSFQLFWCCKTCCCSGTTRSGGTTRTEVYAWMKEKISSRRRVTVWYYTFMVIIFFSMAAYYSAVISINNGFDTYYDSLNYLDDSFTTLSYEGDVLAQQSVDLSSKLAMSNCSAAPAISDSLQFYDSAIDEYNSYVDPVSSPLSDAIDHGRYFSLWKLLIMWSVAGVIYLSLAAFFFAHYLRSKCMMHFAIGFTELVLILIILSNVVWFMVLVSSYLLYYNDGSHMYLFFLFL
jgi:hypothetical protein